MSVKGKKKDTKGSSCSKFKTPLGTKEETLNNIYQPLFILSLFPIFISKIISEIQSKNKRNFLDFVIYKLKELFR